MEPTQVTELPPDPAKLLCALRACRSEAIDASRQVRIGGALYIAVNGLLEAINAIAKLLTGDPEYFWPKGGVPNDAERAHHEKWKKIEAGEEPWPK